MLFVYDDGMGTAKKASKAKAKKRSAKAPGKTSKRLPKRLPVKPLFAVYAGLVVATAITAAAIATSQGSPLPDPFRSEQRAAARFQLYYPARLPEGMSVDAASLARTEADIVTMRITDSRGSLGRAYSLTEQILPAGFNLETFYDSFSGRTTVETKLGTATLGTIDGGKTRLASLVTRDNTWILLQGPDSLSLDDIALTLKHLQPSRRQE